MLLIDEIDRADEEFEAFLLEVLSDFQITIPEIGTIAAARRPSVILTSNRTRELHDALKRRCLFHWIGHPTLEREIDIVEMRVPGIPERLAAQAAAFVRGLRGLDLAKPPGVAETIDWAQALAALGRQELDAEVVEQTLGSVLKYHEDLETVRDAALAMLVEEAARCRLSALVRHVVTFGRVLREAGLEVGPGRVIDALHGPRRGRARAARRRLLGAAADARLPRRGPRGVRPRVRGVVPARARAGAAADADDGAARAVAAAARGDGTDEVAEAGAEGEERATGLERRGAAPPEGLRRADARGARRTCGG